MGETPIPEAFLKGFPENEGENPQTAEEQTFVDQIPKVLEIQKEILRELEEKWEDKTKKDRFFSGLFENDGKKVHLTATQKYSPEMGGIAALSVHYNQYEKGQRVSIALEFVRQRVSNNTDRYSFGGERRVIVEGKGEADRTNSFFWTDYRGNKPINGHNTNVEEGLKFAAEVRDALTGKAEQAKSIPRRKFLSLKWKKDRN